MHKKVNDDDRLGARNFVRYALKIGALEIIQGGRKLKSGRMSPYFFNAGLFCKAQYLEELADSYAACCEGLEHGTVIFGPAYKGVPIAVATALMLLMRSGLDVEYAFNRKEAKDHGECGEIVGASMEGKKVVLVDDVMTTGGSFEEAVTIVRLYGGTPVRCVIAFDRQERGVDTLESAVQAFIAKHHIPVHAVATFADLIEVVKMDGRGGSPLARATLPEILAYREQYGALES